MLCRQLTIGYDCENYQIYHVNEKDTYSITWNGGSIPSYCSIGFVGRDNGYMNEYKVCITKTKWSLPNCGAKVKYEKGVMSSVSEIYNCYVTPTKWCGESDDYVDVVFEATSNLEQGSGEIELEVTAVMTYNYNLTIGVAVGGSIGGLFFLVLAIVLISRARARQCQRRPVILTSGYAGSPPSQGLTNPVMYSSTSGTYPDNAKPPPSYESVMNSQAYNCPPPTAQT
ncbi:uncharacterized protein LOC132545039 [Ylistrum balloti]|uniref:uncharacterized protein LOC132545039 n=1 Tax=Ylistrum balloti TaxID=509963 RepID=UPI0029059E8D|nr:uncharacterized protein LOC132545039 [Ylistrum balloti]